METVQKKRQSLPRHTLIAPIGRRMGAVIVDAALTLLFALVLYFAGTRFIFEKPIIEVESKLITEDIHSHLFYIGENNTRASYDESATYQDYLDVLSYYYLHYLTGEDVEYPEGSNPEAFKAPNYQEYVPGTEKLPKDYYTVQWFNKNVLEITEDIPSENSAAYFQYVLVDGVPDKTQIGIRRSEHYSKNSGKVVEVSEAETANILYFKYESAYLESLLNMDFYYPIYQKSVLLFSLAWFVPFVVGSLISFVIIPIFTSKSATIGKKIFKLGLCGIDGYSMQKWQILPRVIPLLLTIAGMFFIPSGSFYFSLVIGVIILMVSIALYASSPKHCALHDYTARTMVIDAEGSIIFDNQLEEEEFVLAEDAHYEEY